MALRRPVYLDAETLMALADYHDLDAPRMSEVVEKSIKKRSGSMKAGVGALGAGGELGKDIEFQSSYTIQPNEKATVSKVIDALLAGSHVVPAGPHAALAKDDLVEVEGRVGLTAASLAGKLFFVFRRYLESTDQDFINLKWDTIPPDMVKLIQAVYLGNELAPLPVLVDVTGTGLGPRVLVSLQPNSFVDAATIDQIEGERRILGTVRTLVDSGLEGYESTEEWLLSGWEYLVKRLLMAKISDEVQKIVDGLDIELPAGDVHAWIEGPAIVLDAVAVY